MNQTRKNRLIIIITTGMVIVIAATLILYALKQNINVFSTPSDLMSNQAVNNNTIRLGGVVKKGSITHDKQGLGVHFIVTDMKNELPVTYVGVLPDLFREGKGVIAEGILQPDYSFIATQILAKHDENYEPIKIKNSIRNNIT